MPQGTVSSPFLRQFYRRTGEVAVMLLEFGFEAAEQREGIGSRTRESGQNLAVIESAKLFRRRFQDFGAQGDLAVARHHHLAVAADAQDGGRANSLSHE